MVAWYMLSAKRGGIFILSARTSVKKRCANNGYLHLRGRLLVILLSKDVLYVILTVTHNT